MNGASQFADEKNSLLLQNIRPSLAGITQRISEDIDFYKGCLPARNALAWYAWMSGFVESGRLSIADFEHLSKLLPSINVDESLKKFLEPKPPDEHRLTVLKSFDATFEDLKAKLEFDSQLFGGTLPELNNIAWSAYIAALVEYGLVLIWQNDQIYDQFFYNTEDDPVLGILLGRGD